VAKDSVDLLVVIITNSNVMNPSVICKYTLASYQRQRQIYHPHLWSLLNL